MRKERGFTIIELMIATTVLATILVLVSAMMIGIGRLYYKGVSQARIQDTTRSIVDDVSQHLQLSVLPPLASSGTTDVVVPAASPEPGYTIHAWCTGGVRYSYILNRQIGSGTDQDGSPRLPHILWRDAMPATGCQPVDFRDPSQLSANGTELMISNSRLTAFTMGLTSPYNLSVALALGDRDLLNLNGANSTCTGGDGQQFCATSALSIIVVQRISKAN